MSVQLLCVISIVVGATTVPLPLSTWKTSAAVWREEVPQTTLRDDKRDQEGDTGAVITNSDIWEGLRCQRCSASDEQ